MRKEKQEEEDEEEEMERKLAELKAEEVAELKRYQFSFWFIYCIIYVYICNSMLRGGVSVYLFHFFYPAACQSVRISLFIQKHGIST